MGTVWNCNLSLRQRSWSVRVCGKTFQPRAARATLTITGLGLYRAFLNGNRVGADDLTPGFNDYDAYLRTQSYDVTGLLRADNRLEVWLGSGWYRGRLGFDGGNRATWGTRFLLAARLELTARAAQVLGEAADAARYQALVEEIRQALLDEYFSPNGNLTVDTQTGTVVLFIRSKQPAQTSTM